MNEHEAKIWLLNRKFEVLNEVSICRSGHQPICLSEIQARQLKELLNERYPD